jgi:hypothetical protein
VLCPDSFLNGGTTTFACTNSLCMMCNNKKRRQFPADYYYYFFQTASAGRRLHLLTDCDQTATVKLGKTTFSSGGCCESTASVEKTTFASFTVCPDSSCKCKGYKTTLASRLLLYQNCF